MEKWHNFRIQQETETMAMHVLLVRFFSLEDTHPGSQLPQEINQKTQGVDVGDSGSGEDLALSLGANKNWVPQHGKVQPNDPTVPLAGLGSQLPVLRVYQASELHHMLENLGPVVWWLGGCWWCPHVMPCCMMLDCLYIIHFKYQAATGEAVISKIDGFNFHSHCVSDLS